MIINRKILGLALLFAASLLISNPVFGQGGDNGGGDTGGGDTGGGDTGGQTGGDTGGQTGGTVSGGGGGNFAANSATEVEPTRLDLGADAIVIENRRFQGFVGVTSDRIVNNFSFVGPSSTVSSDSDGSFGGGNNSAGGRSGAVGGAGGGGIQPVIVTRRSIRAVLRPSFQSRIIPAQEITTRFVSRLDRQPTTAGLGGKIQVKIENRTATVSGNVADADESNRIVNQLRLEPGIYRIVNNLQVASGGTR